MHFRIHVHCSADADESGWHLRLQQSDEASKCLAQCAEDCGSSCEERVIGRSHCKETGVCAHFELRNNQSRLTEASRPISSWLI